MSSGMTARYLGIARGAVVMTGNTFGLDKAAHKGTSSDPEIYNPGNMGSQGVFLTLDDPSACALGWEAIHAANQQPIPTGIIRRDQVTPLLRIGSAAKLYIPSTVKRILHAELVWFGNISPEQGVNPNTAITFTYPDSADTSVQKAVTIDSSKFEVKYDLTSDEIAPELMIYVRSAKVTDYIVKGEHTYAVKGISAAIHPNESAGNSSGWCLIVAYEDETMGYSNLSIFAGVIPVKHGKSGAGYDILIPNLITKKNGNNHGKVVVACAQGNMLGNGDYIGFGSTTSPTIRLSSGNHKNYNFCISEISIADNDPIIGGPSESYVPDQRGSMGKNNQNSKNSLFGTRQGIDIARIDVSNSLRNSQTKAYVEYNTNSAPYIGVALGAQLESFMRGGLTVDLEKADVGDVLTYTSTIVNESFDTTWNKVYFKNKLPPGTSFVSGSVKVYIDNVEKGGFEQADVERGFQLASSMGNGNVVKVVFQLKVTDFSLIRDYAVENKIDVGYSVKQTESSTFQIAESSPAVTTVVEHGELTIKKSNHPERFVVCNEALVYTIQIENIGNVAVVVPATHFVDTCPSGVAYTGELEANSNQVGSVLSAISYSQDHNSITNVLPLTIRPAEIITIKFWTMPIC